MQAVFTYGNMKSGLTPKTILFGAFMPDYAYHVYAAYGKIPIMPSGVPALMATRNIASIKAMLSRLVQYEVNVRSFYDRELGNTNSPGKSDRIRIHRADITNPTLQSIAMIKSGLPELEAELVAEYNAKQTDFNPNTGKNEPGKPSKPDVSGGSDDFDFSKLILPIGAGLAALFFLKGH